MLTQHLSNKFLLQHQDCGEQRQDLRPQPPAQLPAQHPWVRPQALRGNDNEDNDDDHGIIDNNVLKGVSQPRLSPNLQAARQQAGSSV